MRVALYARVSTIDQSCEMQLAELRAYAADRQFTITQEYVDKGVSGSKSSRPELNKLMIDAKRRKFDTVLAWKLDRFGRSMKHLVAALTELQDYGVAFVSLRDNIDLSTSHGRLMFGILASFAEFERDIIRERVTAGVRRSIQKRGGNWGRKEIRVDLAKVEGLSTRKAAKELGVSHETIRKARANSQTHELQESVIA